MYHMGMGLARVVVDQAPLYISFLEQSNSLLEMYTIDNKYIQIVVGLHYPSYNNSYKGIKSQKYKGQVPAGQISTSYNLYSAP